MNRAALALSVLGAATGCQALTGADEFTVYQGLCTVCPDGTDLKHPPCPRPSNATETGERFVYAARRVRFGKPGNFENFDIGYDLDCSSRPAAGHPAACKARTSDDTADDRPWIALPRGIDNTLATRIFGPLYEIAAQTGQDIDIDKQYSEQQERGELGIVVLVDDWNGTPSDPSVSVTTFLSPGVSPDNGLPRWDGTDRWDRYADLPGNETRYFNLEQGTGYVAEGQLVVDYRDRGTVSLRFGSPKLSFRISVRELFFAGAIDAGGLHNFSMTAIAELTTAYEDIDDLAQVLAGCNAGGEAFLKARLPSLLLSAADMPLDRRTADPTIACDGISLAWSFDSVRAQLGGSQDPEAPPDGGCL